MNKNGTPFFKDLIKNKYHIFNFDNMIVEGYYPNDLLGIIDKLSNFTKKIKIEIGSIYTVRAFFPISDPIENEVEFQSGYLDLKVIMKKDDIYIGEIVTELPPMFVLKKGTKLKIDKKCILYKPDYKTKV